MAHFQINQEEFLDFMFEDLELPNMIKKQLRDATSFEVRRAGFTSVGSPDKLNVVRSLRAANARRIALSGKERRKIRELKAEIKTLEGLLPNQDAVLQIAALNEEIKVLNIRIKRMPFIDEFDLKYNNLIRTPVPSSKAVMFCIMDVSVMKWCITVLWLKG